jgi:hypothetical protein
MRHGILLTLTLLALAAAGCTPQPVPFDQAQIVLTNARLEKRQGRDTFLVDFRFARGRPKKGVPYRFIIVSGSGQEYSIDELLTEKEIRGTVEGTMRLGDAVREPSGFFALHVDVLANGNEWKTISNVATIGTPTADDVIGADGELKPELVAGIESDSAHPTASSSTPAGAAPSLDIGPTGFPKGAPRPRGLPVAGGPPVGQTPSGIVPTVPMPPNTASGSPSARQPIVAGKDTRLAGGMGGVPFRAGDDSGRPVIGFRVALGKWAGHPAISRLEPLYDRPEAGGIDEEIAKDGYAVGGINVAVGKYVQGVQVVFMRLAEGGRLDPSDTYTSSWLGTQSDSEPISLGGDGSIVLGIHGRKAAILDAVGLVQQP